MDHADEPEMTLLVVNPNTSPAATRRIARAAERAAAPSTIVRTVSAPSGVAFIETLEQSRRAGDAVVELLLAQAKRFDAAVIAAYSDPGLQNARRRLDRPVVGIAEASILEAAGSARRFVVLMPDGPLVDYVRQLAVQAGAGDRLAAVRGVVAPLSNLARNPMAQLALFRGLIQSAIHEDGAGAVVIGGGPLAGVAERLASEFTVPLFDGVSCAIRRAERLVRDAAPRSEPGRRVRVRRATDIRTSCKNEPEPDHIGRSRNDHR